MFQLSSDMLMYLVDYFVDLLETGGYFFLVALQDGFFCDLLDEGKKPIAKTIFEELAEASKGLSLGRVLWLRGGGRE